MFYTSVSQKLKLYRHLYVKVVRLYSIPKKKDLGTEIALKHFDQFYSTIFPNWASIRLGLLCPHHYCAVVNTFIANKSPLHLFGDADVFNMKNAYHLNLTEFPDESPEEPEEEPAENKSPPKHTFAPKSIYDDYEPEEPPKETSLLTNDYEDEYMPATQFRNREFDSEDCEEFYTPNINYEAKLIKHGVIHFPEHWDIYYCPRGQFKRFPQPKIDPSGLLKYYLMDGASILPVLALDVKKNEDVGDLCASPGGKSLAVLFGLRFKQLVVNDVSVSRVNKLKTVLNSYLPGTEDWSKKILVSNLDVGEWNCFDAFDKILLDVPCTNDRLSLSKDANNIFQQKRYTERMRLPKVQTALLWHALQALKSGGSLIYSTCSLSPIQNDGVVHMALSKLSVDTSMEFVVNDLTEAFSPLKKMFQFSDVCRYGQLVVPFLPLNYGPMYICKITRTK